MSPYQYPAKGDKKLGMHTYIHGRGESLEMTEVDQTQTTDKITESNCGECENRGDVKFLNLGIGVEFRAITNTCFYVYFCLQVVFIRLYCSNMQLSFDTVLSSRKVN